MSITGLLAEGFESALLACSLILLIPGAAVGLTARAAAVPAVASFSLGVLALSWVRFAGRGGDFPPLLVAGGLMLAAVLLMAPLVTRLDLAAIPAGLLAGGAAAELWLPCVGADFGHLLNELPDRGPSGLGLLALYLFGTLSPLIALAAVHHLTPDWILEKLEPIWAVVGGSLLALLSVATAVGLHDDLVGKLFEWSVTS
jgi:hypothetical protein